MSSEPYIRREDAPFSLIEVDLRNSDDSQLLRISSDLAVGLALEEMKALKIHFEKIGRNPTDIELQTFGQTWSEHCFHKTFKGERSLIQRQNNREKPLQNLHRKTSEGTETVLVP